MKHLTRTILHVHHNYCELFCSKIIIVFIKITYKSASERTKGAKFKKHVKNQT